jgi:hypothetical protein
MSELTPDQLLPHNLTKIPESLDPDPLTTSKRAHTTKVAISVTTRPARFLQDPTGRARVPGRGVQCWKGDPCPDAEHPEPPRRPRHRRRHDQGAWSAHDRLGWRNSRRVSRSREPHRRVPPFRAARDGRQRGRSVRKVRSAFHLDLAPAHLDGPSSGTPGASSLVASSDYWSVPMSFNDALAWFQSHQPTGNPTRAGSSNRGRPGYQTAGIAYVGGKSNAWESAELDLGVGTASDPTHSNVRADGVVVWLNPVPIPDRSPGSTVHFTVVQGCPHSDRTVPDVSNHAPGLDGQLLPADAPLTARACAYNCGNHAPFHASLAAPSRRRTGRGRRQAAANDPSQPPRRADLRLPHGRRIHRLSRLRLSEPHDHRPASRPHGLRDGQQRSHPDQCRRAAPLPQAPYAVIAPRDRTALGLMRTAVPQALTASAQTEQNAGYAR